MSFFISDAMAEAAPATGQADAITGLLPLVIFGAVLYFLMIRPQIKRQKEHKKLVESLSKGDEVVTAGGVAGKISDLGENFILVEISEGTEVKVRRSAVETVMPKGSLKEL
ncbi:MAG: preprotein translocase subunit YajC [Candidatus Thiodiazotropha lotti]|uniref:Sec translocon accessory complex subunit YajC n=1 Tax=Candidatus Thiodiazotropha endoloripes TaxID=1818881 RepID=A0A1E2URE5_9GAMM|nr:preprotein translocase subunit YajC [Candidatus Thiodiazotropha endoloripes]MCG7897611.1 preprotein translocase subunit YajC [Candidatus Thiodiazotropha weberae]MCG7989958.1 preprotein translocase subunit YajC [Candidatus Thiodiazotropha lotti]MCG7903572.1 preprotein translocase subunit YajC [Candidatus Thiodiazotropha weberae]MCG7914391.1 preprotein translocase subunit YajC [Candidatus Thiodiazotropha weberae]MCG8001555.1 preprotein translocase subunit YajC [Candidatus Thiodiazotropha lott